MKKLILTLIVAIATVCGFAQKAAVDKGSVTICFQLASKTAGEKATLIYSDYTACEVVDLSPTTDSEGKWSVKLPADRTIHIQPSCLLPPTATLPATKHHDPVHQQVYVKQYCNF